jgi:hypothetical protein
MMLCALCFGVWGGAVPGRIERAALLLLLGKIHLVL